MTKALLIKTSGEHQPLELPEGNSYEVLRDAVGGLIDCVRNETLVGYVNDEGLLIGLEPNIVASAMFGRPLVGDCVVTSAVNEQGEYDGADYDAPEALFGAKFAAFVMFVLNEPSIRESIEANIAEIMADPSPKVIALSEEEFDAWLEGK